MTTRTSRAALACALLATTCLASPALAADEPPPLHPSIDANGVDLVTGTFNFSLEEASIGSGESELSIVRTWSRGGWNDQWSGNLYQRVENGVTVQYIVFNDRSVKFTKSGTNYVPVKADGSTLTLSGSTFTYTTRDGTVYTFRDPPLNAGYTIGYPCTEMTADRCFLLTGITEQDGSTTTLTWETVRRCSDINCTQSRASSRLTRVTNSAGYKVEFTYAIVSFTGVSPPLGWAQRTSATFTNTLVAGPSIVVSYVLSSSGPRNVSEITDPRGGKWAFSYNGGLSGIKRPGATTNSTSVAYATDGTVSTVTREGVTTNYARSVSGSIATTTITNALGQQTIVTADLTLGRVTSVKDALNRTTSYQYDGNGRLTRVTAPEGNYVQYTLDARGNVTQTQAVAKPGSAAATITTSAGFDAACANSKTCNQPNSTTDARGNVTDYAYDGAHGRLTSITLPAPSTGAVRPQTRFSYTLAGTEYRLTGVSACQTSASCAGMADEVKTAIGYDSNGNVTSTSSGAGDNSLVASRSMTYDAIGNLLTVDGPLAGTADTTRLRYDVGRNLVGTISPDPDGAGALKHRAVRSTINADGQVTKVERGTVTDQSDSAWAAFASLQAVETGYDANARPVTQALVAGGTTYALNQTSYDALGRAQCSAVRMNPAAFSALPASACSLGMQGTFGSDRITKLIYDAAGQVAQVRFALATADEAAEASATYTNNGQVETLTDGENNRTTYVYDGHDRLLQTQFPSSIKGAGVSNAADYEQLSYDAASNITSRRLRDGQVIGFSYDNLSRPTFKDLPGTEPDVSYGYDLLAQVTSASQPGNSLSLSYDALGRNTSQTSSLGTIASQYDLAGRRTRLTHPDGFYVDQDYLTTGEMIAIRENGASSGIAVLATFTYDDLGRRTSQINGNGTVASYSYDAVSRLGQLSHDLPGTDYDLTLGFGYNPASQIAQATRSNDRYSWTGHGSGTTSSSVNGLNQLAGVGSAAPVHDARGNLVSDGVNSFGYSSENRLISQTVPAGSTMRNGTFAYDPLLRLDRFSSGSCTDCRWLYDGLNIALDFANRAQNRRYIYGPEGELLVTMSSYQGTMRRYWMHADERGTIVGDTREDGSFSTSQPVTHDEYGRHAVPTILGFTGLHKLPGSRLVYMRNRVYDPDNGRFLQTDPIGFDGGVNLYVYVGNDPINFVDPSGLCDKARDEGDPPDDCAPIIVTGTRPAVGGGISPGVSLAAPLIQPAAEFPEIVVTAKWRPKKSPTLIGSAYPQPCQGEEGPCYDPSYATRWLFEQLAIGARAKARQVKEYLANCAAGTAEISIDELAKDAQHGAAVGALRGSRQGPWGAARGAITGLASGAARSAVTQSCSKGNK